jgi:hypothetical protein
MKYSNNYRTATCSGFFFDENAPDDAFDVSDADAHAAINLPAGSTYEFTHPVAPGTYGELVISAPSEDFLLTQAQAKQISSLAMEYQGAYTAPIAYRAIADTVSRDYQATSASQDALAQELAIYSVTGAVIPADYYWVATDNSHVPFVLPDLQGLSAAIGARRWDSFKRFQERKSAVKSAVTVDNVLAIVWK